MKTVDPEDVRATTRFRVVDTIRRRGPIARVELAEATDLSPTTVSSITAVLLDDGLIIALPPETMRDAGRGRPRVRLKLREDAAYVVGVKLSPDEITIVVTNFCGLQIKSVTVPVLLDRQPAAVTADLVEDATRRCVGDAGLSMDDVQGTAVGLPGVIERSTGLCRQSAVFRQTDVPFAAYIRERLGTPVVIDTDVNMIAVAHHWFGQNDGIDDFVVVSVEHGLGLGIMHGGEIFRGANGLSPDLSDLIVRSGSSGGPAVRLGQIASMGAVLSRIQPYLPSRHYRFWTTEAGMRELVALARESSAIREVFAEVGEALGQTVANLIALFSPPKVILVGAILGAETVLTDPLRRSSRLWTPASHLDVTDIITRNWGSEMWANGAAAMALTTLYGASSKQYAKTGQI